MRCGITMAAVAGDAISGKDTGLVAIQRISHRKRFPGMAVQTFGGDRAVKIGMRIVFVAGRDVPQAALRVIGKRRLKDVIAHLHEIAEGMIAGANDESSGLFG